MSPYRGSLKCCKLWRIDHILFQICDDDSRIGSINRCGRSAPLHSPQSSRRFLGSFFLRLISTIYISSMLD